MSDQLATVAQIKTRLFPAGVTDTSDDTLISELIDQVSGWIEFDTGRKLVPVSSTTQTFDTVSGYVLHIPQGVRTITTLSVNNLAHQPDSGGTYTTVAASDYLLRPKSADLSVGWPYMEVRISRGSLAGSITSFGTIENGCQITGTFGFAITPPEIAAVCIDAVVAAYQARKNGASGVIGADNGVILPWAQFFSRGSPQRRTLDAYRFASFG